MQFLPEDPKTLQQWHIFAIPVIAMNIHFAQTPPGKIESYNSLLCIYMDV